MSDCPKDLTKALRTYLAFAQKQPRGLVYATTKKQDATQTGTPEQKLKQLYQKYQACTGCPLAYQGRSQVVFGTGNPEATLMFVGEGPGKDEDQQGAPFVGRAGQLLTKIIEAMGLSRDKVYISNVVKCRPPENRTPLPNESTACKDLLLFREIAIIKPQFICTLGSTATQALLGADIRIGNARGQFFQFGNSIIMPTYHPAYLLRNPAEKRTVWEDMKKLMSQMQKKC